jgi:hypothetical protein
MKTNVQRRTPNVEHRMEGLNFEVLFFHSTLEVGRSMFDVHLLQ